MTLIAFYDGAENTTFNKWHHCLQASDPEFTLVPLMDKQADKAEIALVWNMPAGRLAELKQLKLICSLGQGVDHLWKDSQFPPSIPVIRLVDPNMSHALSQWVLAVLLDYLRDSPFYRTNQLKREFNKVPQRDTTGLNVAIYGIGAIGSVVAQNLQSLQFTVQGWAHSHKDKLSIKQAYGESGFQEMLAGNLVHICLLPLTSKTRGVFSRAAFEQMPKGAYFINAGRGDHVVEQDLLASIKASHLSGAALDVFRQEPLPASHPFWEEQRISIWPHVAAQTSPDTATAQIQQAIYDINSGNMPKNLVDRTREY